MLGSILHVLANMTRDLPDAVGWIIGVPITAVFLFALVSILRQ